MNAFFVKFWPVVIVAGGGLIGWGTLSSDVSHLQEEQRTSVEDHDRIVRMETEQKAMKESLDEIKSDVKDIARAVRREQAHGR